MFRTSCFGLVFLVSLQACFANDEPASRDDDSPSPLPAGSQAELQQALEAVAADGVAPGASLTVAHPSYATWSGAAGVANLESGAALTPAERFRAGSMLKTAVAIAVLQLVERGELSLDARLPTLLPPSITSRIPSADAIDLRMLLSHTSGLPEFSDEAFDAEVLVNPTRVWSIDELIDRAVAQPPVFEPGAGHFYSNTNYTLLGEILRETTGKSWRSVVRENVFVRAKLSDTSLPEEGNPRCDGCSRGYEVVGESLVDLTEVDPSMAGAAGGDALVTTTRDLATLLGALASGKLFDEPSTFDLMREFVDAPIPEEAQVGYGLGITQFRFGDIEFFGHLGGTAGFQGFVLYFPETGVATSGFMNQRGNFGAFILPALEAIGRIQ